MRDVTPVGAGAAMGQAARRPRFIEVVLQSRRIVRMSERVLLNETHHPGLSARMPAWTIQRAPKRGWVSYLPQNPDASAQRLVRHPRAT